LGAGAFLEDRFRSYFVLLVYLQRAGASRRSSMSSPDKFANDTRRVSFGGLRNLALQQSFLFLRRFKPARERVTPGEYNDHVEREHVARYEFAVPFCRGKSVADIACGSGYGSRILSRIAKEVHSYDKERLCGNDVIDLERESWNGHYDVIVSFETIEHLANPEFFLDNARKTTGLLIVSTPIGEFRGYNPHHKQIWTFPEFKRILDRYFQCDYYFQRGTEIRRDSAGPIRFVIATGTPRVGS
jgi:2-polyprenyl-3-methyl-5-hydroxy-6-metoxy-1,4-benzoquinol methylase